MMNQRAYRVSAVACLVVFFALFAGSQASAQPGSVSVWEQLQAAHVELGVETHTPSIFHIAKAKNRGHHRHNHLLFAGVEYVVIAACDSACSDLDLAVTVPEEQRILGEDSDEDSVANVAVVPTESGLYVVEIDVAACSESFCYYGYALLRRHEDPGQRSSPKAAPRQ